MNGWFIAYLIILASASFQWAIVAKRFSGWLIGTLYSAFGIAVILFVIRLCVYAVNWLFTG